MAKGRPAVSCVSNFSDKATRQSKMEDIEKDQRFAHIPKDPRFKPNFKQKKVKIDSRFRSMLQDKEFSVKFLDKRGRPVNSSTKEDLRRLYEYESEEEKKSSGEEDEEGKNEESSGDEEEQSESNEDPEAPDSDEDNDSNEEEPDQVEDGTAVKDGHNEGSEEDGSDSEGDDNVDFLDIAEDTPDYARGMKTVAVESSDEDRDDQDEDEKGLLDHHWNEPDHDAPEAEEITARLALCNMDWDRIKARDLYVLFNSFIPQGGAVQSVTIYPSQLGLQKMAEEEKLGPQEFREGDAINSEVGADEDDGGMMKLDKAKLRRYQLNRLAYFYAVIVFDSKETANKIYEECDSMEYEKSSCRLDLRFIPDAMTFEETPKDSCIGVSDLSSFQPSTFTTTAFCQAKVHVTWDETNIERLNKTMQKKFTEEDLDTNRFDEFIASSHSDDSSEEEMDNKKKKKKKRKKMKKDVKSYRTLLGLDGTQSKEDGSDAPTLVGDESDEDELEDMFNNTGESDEEGEEVMTLSSGDEGDEEDDDEDMTLNSDSDSNTEKKDKKKKQKKRGKKSGADSDSKKLDKKGKKVNEKSGNNDGKRKDKKKKKKGDEKNGVVSELNDKKKRKKKRAEEKSVEEEEASEDDDSEVEGEMQYTWQGGAMQKTLKTRGKKKLTPWEQYQEKKKEKKKQKKRERKLEKMRQQGMDDTTDLGFDDAFFNDDEPSEGKKKKEKKKRKNRKGQVAEVEETEAQKKERAALTLLMNDADDKRNHFSLEEIMKEESEGRKRKGKKRKQGVDAGTMDTFDLKLDHSRFAGLYTDPDMHIDPTAPEFKKTKGMVAVMEEVVKRRKTAHKAS